MNATARLSAQERRETILESVKKVFAEKGFDGTTTRELAKAAGVSEALLYKHFPSKESLYAAMHDSCAKGPGLVECEKLMALEPSTSTLVIMVHSLISRFVRCGSENPARSAVNDLMARSLLEDGEFARAALKSFSESWLGKFEECLKAAAKAGDLRDNPVRRDIRGWLVQHVAVGLKLHLQPRTPAIDYKATKDALVEQATWFALLRAGLREEAVRRHYNPKALSLMGE